MGKGDSAQKTYDYFGTFAAGICYGPLDKLFAVLVDGKAVYENDTGLARSGDSTDLTASIDPKFFSLDGYLKIYWGTTGQSADAALSDHPAYKHVAYLMAKNFLFGMEKSTAPNIEIIASRLPVCDTTLCAGADNVFDDDQVNPVAVLAELLTSANGQGRELALLDATTWAAAAHWAYTHRTTRFCSPLITDNLDLRAAILKLLEIISGTLAWTATGTLALKLNKWGEDPGGLTTIDAQFLTAKPKLTNGGWRDVPTGVIVDFANRDRKFKATSVKLDNLVAHRLRGEHHRARIDVQMVITRQGQAEAVAAEAIRLNMHPTASLDLSVRREHAAAFRPGDKVKVDVELEPGGGGLAHLGIVQSRRDKGDGEIALAIKCDPVADSTPYSPVFTPVTPQEAAADSITDALVLPLSPKFSKLNASVAILAKRPQGDATGFRVFFDSDPDGDYAELGIQQGFACLAELDADRASTDTVFRFTLADGGSGVDDYLAGLTPSSEIAAANNELIAIIANVDVDGLIEVTTDGELEAEALSIVSRSAVDSDTHDYTVLRGRMGMRERAWTTSAQVWIIPGQDLVAWSHPDML